MGSKAYFETVAHQWDRMQQSFFSDNVRKKAADRAQVQPGKTAADIGAGTGFITNELLGRGLKVIAVDQSAAMLRLLEAKVGATGLVDCRQGEAEAIPVPAASVDYVFANMYLHHAEHPGLAVKEMARILKPGGKLVITDLDEHDYDFLRSEQHDRWLGFKREHVQEWLKEAGLSAVTVDCLDEQCCSSSAAAPSSCSCSSPEARVSIFIAFGELAPA